MGKKLTDLTERTATADTDLIHVNSSGTDYKESRSNFLKGDLYTTLSNSQTITASAESLPAPGTYFGYISSYSHQSATGMPENANFYVKIERIASTGYIFIEVWNIDGAENSHYIKTKRNGTWDSTWTQLPLRSWSYYNIGSNSYGALECRYNPSLKLCFITWRGNGTAPGSTQYSFNLPSSPVLTPNDNAVVPLRNGDSMEVRTDNTVKVTLTGISWSGGSIMYPTR